MLKTDLFAPILNRGFNLELESIVFRDISLSLEYSRRSMLNYESKYDIGSTASLKGDVYGLKIRSYLNKAIPAPQGAYSYIFYRQGRVDVEADLGGDNGGPIGPFNVDDLIFRQYGIGWGYQTVLKDRFVFDGSWSILMNEMGVADNYPNDFYYKYGYNGFKFGNEHFLWGYVYYTLAFSVDISIGVLLF